jgi:hypothetical protein
MPLIQPDTSEAADLSPIPEGTYPGKIKEVKPTKSKKQENMLETKVSITVPGSDKPRTRKTWIMIEGAGAGNFDQLLRACHFDELADKYKDPSITEKPPFDTDSLVDQDVNVVIVPEIYQRTGPDGNPVGEPELRDRIKGFLKA